MPIYEYTCSECEHEFEELQKFSDNPKETCPFCGKTAAKRKVSASAFHLKGGGWYKDGYSSTNEEKSTKKETPSSSTKKESSKTSTKKASSDTTKSSE